MIHNVYTRTDEGKRIRNRLRETFTTSAKNKCMIFDMMDDHRSMAVPRSLPPLVAGPVVSFESLMSLLSLWPLMGNTVSGTHIIKQAPVTQRYQLVAADWKVELIMSPTTMHNGR